MTSSEPQCRYYKANNTLPGPAIQVKLNALTVYTFLKNIIFSSDARQASLPPLPAPQDGPRGLEVFKYSTNNFYLLIYFAAMCIFFRRVPESGGDSFSASALVSPPEDGVVRRMEQGRPGIGGGEEKRNLQFYLLSLQYNFLPSLPKALFLNDIPRQHQFLLAVARSLLPLAKQRHHQQFAFLPPSLKAPSSPLPSCTSATIFLPILPECLPYEPRDSWSFPVAWEERKGWAGPKSTAVGGAGPPDWIARDKQVEGERDINMAFFMGNSVLHNFHLSGFEVPLVLQGESH